MKRLNDNFLEVLDDKLGLAGKKVLEVGCGNGNKSGALANKCFSLIAIDPDTDLITEAKNNHAASNITYAVGSAEQLGYKSELFDTVLFSLSLHHVPIEEMKVAIQESYRVTKHGGYIVFLEPGFNGSFFDAELLFGASDGDERKEKAAAHLEILNFSLGTEKIEFYDEIVFLFESDRDFINTMWPKKNLKDIPVFLEAHEYMLKAERRINIFAKL